MFETARLKLTAWYLLIIMTISLAFSAVIYRMVTHEFQRRLAEIELRLDLYAHGFRLSPGQAQFFVEDLAMAKQRVLMFLVYTNGVIFITSGVAGYFLAGKTLVPIERTMEEQKRFVSDASHELKTPLASLRTSIEVTLRNKKLHLAAAQQTLRGSLEDVGRLQRLVTDLLQLARYQQGKNGLRQPVDAQNIIMAAVKKITPLAKKKGIAVTVDTQQFTLMAHAETIEKLLVILLDNAVKYTPDGGSVRVTGEKGTRYRTISVSDTGPGIEAEDAPHIFERFFRADQSRSYRTVAGFGLGLSIAKNIVKQHHGFITVKSTPGKGSTFTVKLPVYSS